MEKVPLHMPPTTAEVIPAHEPPVQLSRTAVFVMAAACATSVANIYYNQPLLQDYADYFHQSITRAGFVATAAQVGYGAGLLIFIPLGDTKERRTIVLSLAYACVVLSGLMALAPSLPILIALQFLVGLCAVSPQLLIPLAVDLSAPSERGRIVGAMMAGLLTGLLLARTVSGLVGDHLGWRAMCWIAAAVMLLTALVLQALLPVRPPTQHLPYSALMRSLWSLARTQPLLRTASAISALSFAAFCAFWAVLSFLMRDRFHLGASAAGMFGLVGLAGAMCAPLAGRLSDRRGSAFTLTLAVVLSVLAFFQMWAFLSIAGLIIGVLLLDLGAQSTQVAAQSQAISLIPEARSRLNTVYMVSRFAGGAMGSAAGAFTYARWAWQGTCILCIAFLAVALLIHIVATYGSAGRSPRNTTASLAEAV